MAHHMSMQIDGAWKKPQRNKRRVEYEHISGNVVSFMVPVSVADVIGRAIATNPRNTCWDNVTVYGQESKAEFAPDGTAVVTTRAGQTERVPAGSHFLIR